MLSVEVQESFSEVLDILKHMEKVYIEKIPEKFIKFLNDNKSTIYKVNLDYSKTLIEMKLKEDTKNILGIIYLKYWCNETQKVEFRETLKEKEKVYQHKLREKYNPDNLFKDKKLDKGIFANP